MAEPGGRGSRRVGAQGRILEVRHLGTVPYERSTELQREMVTRRRSGTVPDQLLLLEHPHVITLGSGSRPEHVLADPERRLRMGVELSRAGRGGDVTYHGPGQLVGYPILDLKPDRKDVHRYMRDLEEVLIRVLAGYGIPSRREEGKTGVWTSSGKVAAIGIRVSSGWITSHGFALNVATDLSFFDAIVPCGIADAGVTAMEQLLGCPVSVGEVAGRTAEAFADVFGRSIREAAAPI
jgi:lipoyl(octanoyl) transferase